MARDHVRPCSNPPAPAFMVLGVKASTGTPHAEGKVKKAHGQRDEEEAGGTRAAGHAGKHADQRHLATVPR